MATAAVAVTGGIGAGKSEALAAFARRGVPTVSADEVVHELIASDPEVRAALEERLRHDRPGADREGRLRRPGASSRGSKACSIRASGAADDAWLAGLDAPVAVTEIPLLYETGGERRFDTVS